uniref:USP domain-containing protein n=1 Tax=Octactis speculum TaxID=3111310 RepID=A0A7S2FXJ1_9STRA|mmetsp:Transcript_32078/g.43425  ORF Transcript_32078/g.43425 Transcript_32078/m.43425 type:complete len:290 (+) Transcript_32078:95-964(+)
MQLGVGSALALTFKALVDETERPVSARSLCHALGVNVREQQDAQEFRAALFDYLTSELEPAQGQALEAPFRGKLRHRLNCPDVDFSKVWDEPFVDLPLEVKGSTSIKGALKRFVRQEEMEYRVNKEDKHRERAVKDCRIAHAPEVLQFQLKRFAYDMESQRMVKLGDRLSFDQELDLSPYMSDDGDSNEETLYLLHSVIIHVGDSDQGHYYSYVRTTLPTRGGWTRFDDTRVSEGVRWSQVLSDGKGGRASLDGVSRNAYLLQYVRRDAIPALLHYGDERGSLAADTTR